MTPLTTIVGALSCAQNLSQTIGLTYGYVRFNRSFYPEICPSHKGEYTAQ